MALCHPLINYYGTMKRLLIALCLWMSCWLLVEGKSREVSVSSFGAIPDDGLDDTAALRRAADYCREHRGVTLRIEPGVYQFSDPTAADIERRAINGELGNGLEVQWQLFNPRKPYVTGLDFTGARDLTILADGAVLEVEGWMEVLSFVNTRNVTLKGLTITYRRPAATEARIVSADAQGFLAEFDPDLYRYIDNIVQGRFYFYSQSMQRFYYAHTGKMELVRPGLIRVESAACPPVGDYLIIRYGGHYRPCIMLKESRSVTVADVTIHSFPGMGIVGHLTEDILIDGLKVVPEPGRYSSTNTDATHFTSCSGQLTIRNSIFKGNGDDCTNVHNYYYTIYPQLQQPRKVEIRIEGADLHAQSLDYPEKGDTLLLVDQETLETRDRFVVRGVDTSVEKWQVLVTLNKDFPAEMEKTCYMVNHSRYPRVSILNNRASYANARAFLLKVPHCVIAGNYIEHSTHTAIKLGGELSWREAGPVESALIEGNYISGCGEAVGEGTASCVMVSTEARKTPPYVNRNIIIRNNVFHSRQRYAILLQDADNVLIEHNRINSSDYVRQDHCRQVTIKDYPQSRSVRVSR